MDSAHFDRLVAALAATPSRRALLAGVAGGAVGLLGAQGGDATHYGCRHVGKPCARGGQCCSGRCRGRPGNKKCRAHDTGGCTLQMSACVTADPTSGCPANLAGQCNTTTGNAPFCAIVAGSKCEACRTDRDCEALGYPRGSACLYVGAGICAGGCATTNDTACAAPAA